MSKIYVILSAALLAEIIFCRFVLDFSPKALLYTSVASGICFAGIYMELKKSIIR